MGEVAESIIEGEVCQQCFSFFRDVAPGHPRTCADCLKPRLPRRIKRPRPKPQPSKPAQG